MVDGLIDDSSGCSLLSTYGIEGHQYFFIHYPSIEKYRPYNWLDTFDASSIKTRASYFFWGLLYFVSMVNFTMFVGRYLRFGREIVAKSGKYYFNVYIYR